MLRSGIFIKIHFNQFNVNFQDRASVLPTILKAYLKHDGSLCNIPPPLMQKAKSALQTTLVSE